MAQLGRPNKANPTPNETTNDAMLTMNSAPGFVFTNEFPNAPNTTATARQSVVLFTTPATVTVACELGELRNASSRRPSARIGLDDLKIDIGFSLRVILATKDLP